MIRNFRIFLCGFVAAIGYELMLRADVFSNSSSKPWLTVAGKALIDLTDRPYVLL